MKNLLIYVNPRKDFGEEEKIAIKIQIDNSLDLGWKKEVRIFAPYQKTFEAIGNMRYFPESLMGNKKVKKIAGDKYRVGHFPNPYPNFEGKDIKVHNK